MTWFVGGINGTGKSAVLREVQRIDTDIDVLSVSAEYMKYLGLRPGSYDELRRIPEDVHRLKLNTFLVGALENRRRIQPLILDAHYVVYDQDPYPRVKFGPWIEFVDGFVLLETNPNDLLQRVRRDAIKSGRQRSYLRDDAPEEDQIDEIISRQNHTKETARLVSSMFQSPLRLIDNTGNVTETAEVLVRTVRNQNPEGPETFARPLLS